MNSNKIVGGRAYIKKGALTGAFGKILSVKKNTRNGDLLLVLDVSNSLDIYNEMSVPRKWCDIVIDA